MYRKCYVILFWGNMRRSRRSTDVQVTRHVHGVQEHRLKIFSGIKANNEELEYLWSITMTSREQINMLFLFIVHQATSTYYHKTLEVYLLLQKHVQ